MYIDSHCHLNFPALQDQLPDVLERMRTAGVGHALVVSVNLRDWPGLMALVERHPFLRASVGVHPDNDPEDDDGIEPTLDDLVSRAAHPRVVAIGETGLDYYRQGEPLEWQRERFRTHIRAAHETGLPLIIHTRAAAEDCYAGAWRERVRILYGVEPEIEWFETPVGVDNVLGTII